MKSVRIVKEEVSGHEVIDKVLIMSPFLRRRMWIVWGGHKGENYEVWMRV